MRLLWLTAVWGGDGVQANLQRVLLKESTQHPPPADPPHSTLLNKALSHAEQLRTAAHDSHMAADHLLLGLAHEGERAVKEALFAKDTRLTVAALEQAAATLRQKKPVASEQAEDTWDALATYAHDLVAMAEAGKLDPVIGRDEVAASAMADGAWW